MPDRREEASADGLREWNKGRLYGCGTVPPSSNKSLKVSLEEHLSRNKNFGVAAWKRRIFRGQILVEGVVVNDPRFLLSPGNRISYCRAPWREPIVRVVSAGRSSSNELKAADDPHILQIIHQDKHLMAVHKPSGLPTMPSQTFYEYSVLQALRRQYATDLEVQSPPQPVHRLGVGTSGVLLVAISPAARKHLTASIREKKTRKIYRALVQGADIPDTLEIDCPIGAVPFPIGGGTIYAAVPTQTDHESNSRCAALSATTTKTPMSAFSRLRVVRRNHDNNTAVVEVEIPTGRPHQIRIHLAFVGYPLVGDPLYLPGGIPDRRKRQFPRRRTEDEDPDTDDEDKDGLEEPQGDVWRVALPRDCGYSLHAYSITVPDPGDPGRSVTFVAPPPKHLAG